MAIGVGNKDKCNRQNVCENHRNEIHVCSKKISQTNGKRKEQIGNVGHFDNTKGDAYLSKAKLDDLLKQYKDIDGLCMQKINWRNMMIQWNVIQHYAPNNQRETPNAEPNECWELVEAQFK